MGMTEERSVRYRELKGVRCRSVRVVLVLGKEVLRSLGAVS